MTAAEMMAPTIPAPPPTAPFKICACGQPYDATQWTELRLVGVQVVSADDEGPEERYELRDCARCRSTLAIQVPT